MRAVVQRVKKASVTFDSTRRQIGAGIVVFVGVGNTDTDQDISYLSDKILNLRIFPDDNDMLDKSVLDIMGEILVVSQFTLYGNTTRGRRPDFIDAAKPEQALPLYEKFVEKLSASKLTVQSGKFQTKMLVEVHNDGPVTILLDSKPKTA